MSYFRMLVSDLDGTLLGDDDALQSFLRWRKSTARNFRLVYATGQFVKDVQELLSNNVLPMPDAIIGGVGTEIALPNGEPLENWPVVSPGSWNDQLVREALTPFAELTLQPARFQSAYKVSYFADHLSEQRLEDINESLACSGLAANVLYSSHRFLDVLPEGVDKGLAARWLAVQWGIPPRQVIACGDSGNDLPLFEQGFMGVVVENASSELREKLGVGIYRARMGFAAGVVEGMGFWT